MSAKYKLLCVSSDGEFQLERPSFDSIEKTWAYNGDIGSKWYFYPFRFIVSESGKTIRNAGDGLELFNNRRVKTMVKKFKQIYATNEAKDVGVNSFIQLVNEVK